MVERQNKKFLFALPSGLLIAGLTIFYIAVYFVDAGQVFIGKKNFLLIALFPSIVYWIYRVSLHKIHLPGYVSIFYSLPVFWSLSFTCFFFLIVGITTRGLWLIYLLSQVLYLGGWIVILGVARGHSMPKWLYQAVLLITIIVIVLILLTNENQFIRVVPSPLFPMPIKSPYFLLEILMALIGIGVFYLVLRGNFMIYNVLSLAALIACFQLTDSGRSFFGFFSYDYVFFAPFLLASTISAELILWSLFTRAKKE